eukprot:TRINITY_DN1792_c0_g1_i9.p2 TRINITY_DN1792_c0_g1~~TRINITY_DN1792_c0_g1_i9.p2  ORF type:complete len:170 (+),score=39.54 TRINITY_DN1792_c0_g1_i9:474-983(+)
MARLAQTAQIATDCRAEACTGRGFNLSTCGRIVGSSSDLFRSLDGATKLRKMGGMNLCPHMTTPLQPQQTAATANNMSRICSMHLSSAEWHCSTSLHQPATSQTPLERETLMGVRQQLWQTANGSSHSSICNRGSGSRAATATASGSRQQQPQAESWQAVAADSSSHRQ